MRVLKRIAHDIRNLTSILNVATSQKPPHDHKPTENENTFTDVSCPQMPNTQKITRRGMNVNISVMDGTIDKENTKAFADRV